jgi:hypothetical protein
VNEEVIKFDTPGQVLAFIRECLNSRDAERLYAATLEEPDQFWRQRIFDDLCEIEASNTLEQVFLSDQSFPSTRSEFKLGGHSIPTKHLHIDLIRHEDAWRLKRIWKCR